MWINCLRFVFIPLVVLRMISPVHPESCSSSAGLPRYDLIGERSVLLAEKLVQTDLNTASDLSRSKTALVEIRSAIVHSDLEKSLREDLAKQFSELKELIVDGAQSSSILSASFETTVDRMHNAMKLASDDLREMSESLTGKKNTNTKTKRKDSTSLLSSSVQSVGDGEILSETDEINC